MTPTQFDALNSAIAASVAASREALAKIDILLARLNASEPVEPFNSPVYASEDGGRSKAPAETAPPCGYPPEPAPEGMRWRYVGPGLYQDAKWLDGYCCYHYASRDYWRINEAGTMQNAGPNFHYFTAEAVGNDRDHAAARGGPNPT